MHAVLTGEEVGRPVVNKPLPGMWMATSAVTGVRPASGITCKPAVHCFSVSPCPARSDGTPKQPVNKVAGIETDKQINSMLTDRPDPTMHTIDTKSGCQRKMSKLYADDHAG